MSPVPDVSVIVAVHNSLPHLTECLTSLVEQSIGRERLQVVAVDAGSTDGSGAELDRFAALHPHTFTVLRQEPGRGPAAPNNRGLECATGRYIFFVCPDDHLGPQALERLVDAADRWESDVVAARMVGVNGRQVPTKLFESTQRDVDFFAGTLPWALSGIRFFRRALIERHRLRFPEDMRTGSDQPFTIEACLQAHRISVLGDYDYYYAVKRDDRRQATARVGWDERLRCAQRLVEFDVVRLDPGPRRDALLQRHFGTEVAKLLRTDFLDLDVAAQRQIHAVLQKLTTQYLGAALETRLPHGVRQRLAVVRHGNLEDLRVLLRQLAEPGKPRVVVEGDRWYRPLLGFRDERFGLPEACYDISGQAAVWVRRFTAIAMNWRTTDDGELVLSVNARNPWRHLAAVGPEAVRITAGDATAVVRMLADEVAGTVAFVDLPVAALIDAAGPEGRKQLPVRLHTYVGGEERVGYLKLKGRPSAPRRMIRRGARVYLVTPYTNNKGRLVIAIAAVTPRRLAARLRRMLPAAGR
ncbi:glycosyltransferase family 2 protein [Melissospora conviva]|uniref:glycosyltransferase family 2 protein n=1 Tax=Melissospora conviva TaxID=3388432 RepID=UPI003C16CC28